ncbi:hypothetical protein GOL30_14335 [Sinorhizobium medicae]|uniref:Uncharacterized protein n=1 Tax=Sinorhizobium medicae TaxID=110321 RepID=A0A6G1WGK8_9HYPH|nr:hypothetical protein [Sinorhizobium medicae]MDX0412806.1 hypothetical protein [Sinorhizobium medicae]MDX0419078.1 hypothetical protein [Sinorhizobium medicae]MDX0430147.1 hypothetical protein [Sinorhizobium medicae]MDX0437457.1 hypothetical protein [Sinorhizobium medicae]
MCIRRSSSLVFSRHAKAFPLSPNHGNSPIPCFAAIPDGKPLRTFPGIALLHVSFDRIRLKDKNMQQIKVLQRPLCL